MWSSSRSTSMKTPRSRRHAMRVHMYIHICAAALPSLPPHRLALTPTLILTLIALTPTPAGLRRLGHADVPLHEEWRQDRRAGRCRPGKAQGDHRQAQVIKLKLSARRPSHPPPLLSLMCVSWRAFGDGCVCAGFCLSSKYTERFRASEIGKIMWTNV